MAIEVTELELENAVTIGEIARSVGVSTRTIRYYEELGILPPPPRTSLGTRLYPLEWRFYLEGALALKDLGFKLNEIALVGRLALDSEAAPEERERALQLVANNTKVLERRIAILKAIKQLFSEQGKQVPGGLGAVVSTLHGDLPDDETQSI